MSLDQFRAKSLELLIAKSRVPSGDETKTFNYYLQCGKIEEAGKVVERLLDNNKNEEIFKMFRQFVSGNQTEEGIEMLCLFRILKNSHQKNLVKLLLEMKKQVTVSELMENFTLVEKLQISSLDIDILLAYRCIEAISVVKLSESEKAPFCDVFAKEIFPKILDHSFSEDVPYDEWLALSLRFLFNRILRSNSSLEPDPLTFNLVEKTFSILSNMDSQELISGRGTERFLRSWMITKAKWKSWSTKQVYYVLQVLLISITAIWKNIKIKFPYIRILKLPFSSQFISACDPSALREQWIATCLGEEFGSYSSHLSSPLKTALVETNLGNYKIPVLECLIFVNDVVDICTHVNHFRKILCSSAEIIDQLEMDAKSHLQSFLQVLVNVAPNVFMSWNASHSVEKQAKVNEVATLSMRYYMEPTSGALVSDFIKRASFGFPKISSLRNQPVCLSGYLCMIADPTTEMWYALSLYMHFLLSKLKSQQEMKSQRDTGLVCFTYLMTQLNWPVFLSVASHITLILAQMKLSSLILDENLCDLLFIPKVIDSLHSIIKNNPDCTIYSTSFGKTSDEVAQILSHEKCFVIFEKCFSASVESFPSDKSDQLLQYIINNIDTFST